MYTPPFEDPDGHDHSQRLHTVPQTHLPNFTIRSLTKHLQIVGVRVLLWIVSLFVDMTHVTWDESVIDGLHFLEHTVLQVPFFLMTMMRYITPTLDRM